MKTKSIILSALLLIGVGAFTTSCEDMFTAENKLVQTDLAPRDTVYQIMGIVQNMQKIADRTVILGEVRADLVDINSQTPIDLQAVADNAVTIDNAYNNPTDYYAVINSCNTYLAYVDTALLSKGEQYYRNEIIAAKCFRAWTYLELAKIYGKVPFVTEPVITASDADNIVEEFNKAGSNGADMLQITSYFIKDLEPYSYLDKNRGLLPSYGQSYITQYFIPVRLMLAELYLYRGAFTRSEADYREAVRYYHDFLTFPGEELPTRTSTTKWDNNNWQRLRTGYTSVFEGNPQSMQNDYQFLIPMDTVAYYGTYSDLRSVFCAQYSNNYYAAVNPSARLGEISRAQDFCLFIYNSATDVDTAYAPKDASQFATFTKPELMVGDLRLYSVYDTEDYTDLYHSEYSTSRQYIRKYTGASNRLHNDQRQNYIGFYRRATIYLHLAEALNGAGLPETAFAVLKWGLSWSTIGNPYIVSEYEYNILKSITSHGFSGPYANAAGWDENQFYTRDYYPLNYTDGAGFANPMNQIGIHSIGCGDSWANGKYYLPTDSSGILPYPEFTATLPENATAEDTLAYTKAMEDYIAATQMVEENNAAWLESETVRTQRQQAVALMILEEEALEGTFEGTRFYDLMRYSKWSGNTAYLGEAIAKRKGAANISASLQGKLASEAGWYLPLKKR